jgi:hypothetical protein
MALRGIGVPIGTRFSSLAQRSWADPWDPMAVAKIRFAWSTRLSLAVKVADVGYLRKWSGDVAAVWCEQFDLCRFVAAL